MNLNNDDFGCDDVSSIEKVSESILVKNTLPKILVKDTPPKRVL